MSRAACRRAAYSLRALVQAVDDVLDSLAAVAVVPALAEDCLMTVEGLAVEPCDRQVAEQRADVAADRLLVPLPGGLLDVEEFEVAVHELVHGRLGARVALLVDLIDEPGADLLGLRPGLGAGGHGLNEVVPLAAQGVDAGVHAHP